MPISASSTPATTIMPDDRIWPERAGSMTPLLRERAAAIEAQRELTADVLDALHERELFRLTLPAHAGGYELPVPVLAAVTEIIAGADASTAWCLGQAFGCAMSAAFMDEDAAREVFGPPDAVLAWGAGAQGTAVATDGGYRVTGTWKFASGAKHATWLGGHCMVYEADGNPRLGANGVHANRTALFPREQAAIADDWYVMGLRGTRSEGYTVEDLFVESRLTLDRETPAECRLDSTLYIFPTTNVYASVFSGVALGIARAMLDDLVGLARKKSQRGARTSMRDSAVVHTRLAELEAQLRGRARLPARDDSRGLGRGGGLPRAHDGAARPHPARDHVRHQSGDRGLRAGLPPRGRDCDIRGPCLRTQVPRCARGLAASPGAPHELRDGGPPHARPRHRDDLHVTVEACFAPGSGGRGTVSARKLLVHRVWRFPCARIFDAIMLLCALHSMAQRRLECAAKESRHTQPKPRTERLRDDR